MTGSLNKSTTRGVFQSAGANLSLKLLGLVVQVVLAWLLGPDAFGAWALTIPVMTLSDLIRTSGAREILVSRQRAFRVWAGPALWISGLMGLVASLFTASLAYPMAWIYDRPELVVLVLLCVPAPFIGSLQSVPEAKLLSQNRFGGYVTGLFVGGVLLLVCQILFALLGFGAKTFPLALVVSTTARVVLFWVLGNPGCSLRPRVERWKYLVGDASRLVGTRLADWFSVNAPPLVLGLYFSDAVVGIFAYATNMSAQAIRLMAINLSTILFAALAGTAREPERQRNGFLKSSGVLAAIGMPICFLQAALAEPVLSNVLPIESWPGLILTFQMLSVAMGIRLLAHPSRSYLLAQGRFSVALWLSAGSALLYMVGAIVAAPFGVVALAATQSVLHLITAVAWFVGSLLPSRPGFRRGVKLLTPITLAGLVKFK
ncbi:MAG: oligosaccharide flippase family protein, partial [Phycisphaerales bacterium]|nr:oligosaccharide flippase family protein [Phycisphaerales bacterium]